MLLIDFNNHIGQIFLLEMFSLRLGQYKFSILMLFSPEVLLCHITCPRLSKYSASCFGFVVAGLLWKNQLSHQNPTQHARKLGLFLQM